MVMKSKLPVTPPAAQPSLTQQAANLTGFLGEVGDSVKLLHTQADALDIVSANAKLAANNLRSAAKRLEAKL